MLLWAVGDACPRCHKALHVARQRRTPGGLFGKTLALQAARSSANAGRGRDQQQAQPAAARSALFSRGTTVP
jgi:hypothetical protein